MNDASTADSYGELISGKDAMDLETFLNDFAGDSLNVKLNGKINEVCQNKGCWMTLDAGKNGEVRVTFKNYGFFVPKDISGRTAIVEGVIKRKVMDVSTLKHYARDEGKSAREIENINEPLESYVFVASGVLVK